MIKERYSRNKEILFIDWYEKIKDMHPSVVYAISAEGEKYILTKIRQECEIGYIHYVIEVDINNEKGCEKSGEII